MIHVGVCWNCSKAPTYYFLTYRAGLKFTDFIILRRRRCGSIHLDVGHYFVSLGVVVSLRLTELPVYPGRFQPFLA